MEFERSNGEVVRLITSFEVCQCCHGTGTTVNSNIDGHGLTRADFDEDLDFERDYFAGVYDITCPNCKGLRVVEEVDIFRNSQEILEEYYEDLRIGAEIDAVYEAERRFGA